MRKMICRLISVLVAGLMHSSAAHAAFVKVVLATPINQETTTVTMTIGSKTVDVLILPGTSAEKKADRIVDALIKKYPDLKFDLTPLGQDAFPELGFSINVHADIGTFVTFSPGRTGEKKDTLQVKERNYDVEPKAFFGFGSGIFESLDSFGDDANFTGGFITDVGELSVSIVASSLPSLDGTAITQALFDELSAFAPAYGAAIFNGGDYLGFSFEPALTTKGWGVTFGTTSPSEGLFGSVFVPVPEPASAWLTLLALWLLAKVRSSVTSRHRD